jgi:hypothetical protein
MEHTLLNLQVPPPLPLGEASFVHHKLSEATAVGDAAYPAATVDAVALSHSQNTHYVGGHTLYPTSLIFHGGKF